MDNRNQNTLRFGMMSIVITLSLLIGSAVYYNSLIVNLQRSTCRSLNEIMLQEKNSFARALDADKEILKGYATLVSLSLESPEEINQVLTTITQSTDFEDVVFVETSGKAIYNGQVVSDLSDRAYFRQAMAGDTVISEPMKSKLKDVFIITVATPIFQGDAVCGVLVGSFRTETLNEFFTSSFDGYGYTYIVTNTGDIIAKTPSVHMLTDEGNLFELYQEADFFKEDSYALMRQNLVEEKGGHAQYKINGQRRLMHYDKLPINNWNIFVVINPQGVEQIANVILRDAILLTLGMLAVLVGLQLYSLRNQRRFNEELQKMAFVDEVTGLKSFGKFKLDAAELIKKPYDGFSYMFVKMDIDNFKLVNEMHTMEMGDRVLKAVAQSLEQIMDQKLDTFARVHADEFIILVSFTSLEHLDEKRQHFHRLFEAQCRALIGTKLILPKGRYRLIAGETDFTELYEKVNFAHRIAKTRDHKDNDHEVEFDGDIKNRAIREKEIERKMEAAMQAKEFHVFLQPKYCLKDERMVGAEALVRWITADLSMIYPNEFIPLFESNGFILRLDYYMFEQACQLLTRWLKEGVTPVPISVNFSRLHLGNSAFVEELCAIADRYHTPHALLEIELTETTMLENIDVLEEVLLKIHNAGFILSMDDFGTGYSSLSLLKNISVDVIKIDKSFFDEAKDLNRARTVIGSVMDMAHSLGIHTVAEGVETKEHIALLQTLGCETVQGYYYAKPMTIANLEERLTKEQPIT